MEIRKAKTRRDKLIEKGLPINYCNVIILQGKIERKIEMVYKAIKFNPNEDNYLLKRIRLKLKFTDKIKFSIKKIEIIKSMGYGVFED